MLVVPREARQTPLFNMIEIHVLPAFRGLETLLAAGYQSAGESGSSPGKNMARRASNCSIAPCVNPVPGTSSAVKDRAPDVTVKRPIRRRKPQNSGFGRFWVLGSKSRVRTLAWRDM